MIAFFVYNLGAYSGAAFQALNLAIHLKRPVTIFNTGSRFDNSIPDYIRVVNLPETPLYRTMVIAYHNLIRRPKLIHFHGQFFLPMAIAWLLRIPYILKSTLVGDDDFNALKRSNFGWFRLWLSRRCAFNVVLSGHLKNINEAYLPRKKIRLIPNAVRTPVVCNDLSMKCNHFYFCGVLSARKNPLKSIRIFAERFAQLPNAKMYVIGPDKAYGVGREIDDAYVRSCKTYVVEHGLKEKVEFMGLLTQAQVIEISKRCKALLFFSEAEGMPNVVLEAMASNCVPVISAMQGVGFEILTGAAGYVCEDEDEDDIPEIAQIDRLIEMQAPYSRVKTQYSFDTLAHSIDALYRECLQTA